MSVQANIGVPRSNPYIINPYGEKPRVGVQLPSPTGRNEPIRILLMDLFRTYNIDVPCQTRPNYSVYKCTSCKYIDLDDKNFSLCQYLLSPNIYNSAGYALPAGRPLHEYLFPARRPAHLSTLRDLAHANHSLAKLSMSLDEENAPLALVPENLMRKKMELEADVRVKTLEKQMQEEKLIEINKSLTNPLSLNKQLSEQIHAVVIESARLQTEVFELEERISHLSKELFDQQNRNLEISAELKGQHLEMTSLQHEIQTIKLKHQQEVDFQNEIKKLRMQLEIQKLRMQLAIVKSKN